MKTFDLIIVGGGLVGTGLALALRASGLRLALIDANPPSANDHRLFALNQGSCQFLAKLGVWPSLLPHVSPIHEVHVSKQGHFGCVRLQRQTLGVAALGHVIPAYRLESALHQALEQSDCFRYRPATVTDIQQHAEHATLTLTTPENAIQLQSPLIIAADGSHSTLRKQLAIPVETVDYQQRAIVTRTGLQRPHQQIAYERFTANGAIAMLPLGDNEYATIWSTDNEAANHLLRLSDADFLQALQHSFGYKLGRLKEVKERYSYPLLMQRAKQAVQGSVLLLGNAHHTLHPIAAQGLNLALYEVSALVAQIRKKQSLGQPISIEDMSMANQQALKQQKASIFTSHYLAEFATHSSFLMSIAWQLGMLGFDMLTPLKRQFMASMMGNTH